VEEEIHVVPEIEDSWVVETESFGMGSIHETKQEALEEARELAANQNTGVVIHGADGQIKDREEAETAAVEPELDQSRLPEQPPG
jgi:hypothetical protein